MSPYERAQIAFSNLKIAVYETLLQAPQDGLSNAEIGRSLGIYAGHIGHEGHISRTVLAQLESDGVAQQDRVSKRWTLRRQWTDEASPTDSCGQP